MKLGWKIASAIGRTGGMRKTGRGEGTVHTSARWRSHAAESAKWHSGSEGRKCGRKHTQRAAPNWLTNV